MEGVWRSADRRVAEFDASAVDYDRYRPRYPDSLFDDIVDLGALAPGAAVVEIGAGTGIATRPLVERGLRVTAIEPSPGMAEVGKQKPDCDAVWIQGRFEDVELNGLVDAVVAVNAWHWVDPSVGVDRTASLLRSGGCIALVWTPVIAWGSSDFEDELALALGASWPKELDAVLDSRRAIERDDRFGPFLLRRHRFERTMDAATFVAVARTYGGPHHADRDAILTRLVDNAGGKVTKVEEAVLYLAQRR